jgi:hypothetical protein
MILIFGAPALRLSCPNDALTEVRQAKSSQHNFLTLRFFSLAFMASTCKTVPVPLAETQSYRAQGWQIYRQLQA